MLNREKLIECNEIFDAVTFPPGNTFGSNEVFVSHFRKHLDFNRYNFVLVNDKTCIEIYKKLYTPKFCLLFLKFCFPLSTSKNRHQLKIKYFTNRGRLFNVKLIYNT